jgi:DNA-directed RNA polymerase specialized sigma subunit
MPSPVAVNSSQLSTNIICSSSQISIRIIIVTAIDSLDERAKKIITMLYLRDPAASYAEVAALFNFSRRSEAQFRHNFKNCLFII